MSESLTQVALRDRTRREITHRSDHIPPLPENVTRLLALLDKEDTEPEDLEGLVSQDQVLVGRLLKLANSPLYGVSREMSSIKDATMVVGFRGLRSLVMASSTAQHLKRLGVIDRIVKEPIGGAHRDPAATAQALGKAIDEELAALSKKDSAALIQLREERFLQLGG